MAVLTRLYDCTDLPEMAVLVSYGPPYIHTYSTTTQSSLEPWWSVTGSIQQPAQTAEASSPLFHIPLSSSEEVISHNDLVSVLHQPVHQVGADKPTATSHLEKRHKSIDTECDNGCNKHVWSCTHNLHIKDTILYT